ncbi:MAG: aminoglycoside 6-adenylyltransferase [Bacteroidota bacterium]|nr:aminoglycoside 6-adenylyltransferase [Bacteroidota bacterium]
MRSSKQIKKIIIDKANSDDRVRAVFLNGSRANNKVKPDQLQDFDIFYIVKELESFTSDHSWTNIFGDKIIWQLPDEMGYNETENGNQHETFGFHYLMLFKDGNRIDLTLFPEDKIKPGFHFDSLTLVWLDKDNAFPNIGKATDFDYLIKVPTEKEFLDTCNEFWWICTYVSKGLLRSEITYSKEMLETVVRPKFMKMIEWYIGTKTNFSVSFGKSGRFMNQYLSKKQYHKILSTYSDQKIEHNWNALFIMTALFSQFANDVANRLNFEYNYDEERNVSLYLKKSYKKQTAG